MSNVKAANHLAGQLLRSGTSPALNYREAQSGESRKDFIHKIKIVLKELRESNICLSIINRTGLCKNENKIINALNGSNEMIAIFVKSVGTTQKNSHQLIEKKQLAQPLLFPKPDHKSKIVDPSMFLNQYISFVYLIFNP